VKQLGRTQFAQRRLFSARESAFLGAIGNAVRLHYAALRERGGLANLFKLMISPPNAGSSSSSSNRPRAGPVATTGAEPQ